VKAITKKRACLALALCLLTGCSTDSAHTLSRDYRNVNNEAIDALMLVTNESRAKIANVKIVKTYPERVGDIDRRMASYVQNQEEVLVLSEVLSSESVMILFAECKINLRRLDKEQERLKKLLASLVQNEKDRRKEANNAEEVQADKLWPNLDSLARSDFPALRNNLKKGTGVSELMAKFALQQFKKARDEFDKIAPGGFDKQMKAFNERVNQLDQP
jgi:DNA-directed RNA polymerase